MARGRFRPSSRAAFPREPTPLGAALAERPAPAFDLTVSNPTRVSLGESAWCEAGPDRTYRPSSLGDAGAREAVARYYRARGATVDPGRIVLSASSSEAYGWLLQLLCDPGDAVLAPEPSYPLIPLLARLAGVRVIPYPLRRDEAWRVDLSAVARLVADEPTVRAMIAVHPANPTGAMLRREDAEALPAILGPRPLIVDEVFLDYATAPDRHPTFAGTRAPGFVLSGLSKVALLPQLKVGWTVINGPAGFVEEARAHLEIVADSYLSVTATGAERVGPVLERIAPVQRALRGRLAHNLAALDEALAATGAETPLRRLPRDGGWYAMVDVPRTRSDEAWVIHTLDEVGVLVQPGYFYDVAEEGVLVVSLLPEPSRFEEAIRRAAPLWAAC